MALTRIRNNQIYTSDINAAVKIQLGSITGNLLNSAITHSGNLTSGNITASSQFISTATGSTATNGGQIFLNGATSNRIDFAQGGLGDPNVTVRSAGTKIVLWPLVDGSGVDYAIGLTSGVLWNSVHDETRSFKWFANTTAVATLTGTGNFTVTGAAQANSHTGVAVYAGTIGNTGASLVGTLTGSATSATYVTGLTAANVQGIIGSVSTGSFPTLNQNTTGNASSATYVTGLTAANVQGVIGSVTTTSFPTLNQNTTGSSQYVTGLTAANVQGVIGSVTTTSFPTLNQNTTGSSQYVTGLTAANVQGVIGSVSTGSFPTLNQNTTGTAATVTGSSQSNITTLTALTNFGTANVTTTAAGNFTISGNLTVQGNTSTIGSSDLVVQDSIINLHTYANLAPWTSNDGRDIGIKFHYYDNADKHAFLGRANDTGYLEFYANGNENLSNVFTGTQYGTIKTGELNLANTTVSTSTTSGALQVAGGAGIVGALYANSLTGVAVYAGTIGNTGATLTGTLSTAAQTNITSVGTLSSLTVTGNVNAGTLIANTYGVYAGNYYWANGTAFNGYGVYSNTNVGQYLPTYTGNLTPGNVTATSYYGTNYLYTNGVSILSGVASSYGNTQVAAYLPTYNGLVQGNTHVGVAVYAGTIGNTGATLTGTLSTAAQTNITSVGTLSSLTATGAVQGNTHTGVAVYAGTIGNTGATLTGTLSTAAQTNITSLGTLASLAVSGAVTGNTFTGVALYANTIGNTNSTHVGTIGTNAQPYITSVGTLTSLASSGNVTLSNNQSLRFTTVGGSYVSFIQQNDDNLVLYSTNTTGAQRAIWSIFANSTTSTMNMGSGIGLSVNTISIANGGGIIWAANSAAYSSGGAATNAAGSNTYIQFNDGGTAFGGSSSFTFNKTTGSVTADTFRTNNNGNGTNYYVGDDMVIGDINIANTTRFTGLQDGTQGYIVFGNSNATNYIGRSGTNPITVTGNFATTGAVTGNTFTGNSVYAGTIGNTSSYIYGNTLSVSGFNVWGNNSVTGITLGSTLNGAGNQINNVIIGFNNALAGYFSTLTVNTTTTLTGNATVGNLTAIGSGTGGQLIGYHNGPIGANVANTGAFTSLTSTTFSNIGTSISGGDVLQFGLGVLGTNSTNIYMRSSYTNQDIYIYNTGNSTGGIKIAGTSGNTFIQATTASTSNTTGALTVAGGLGVAGNINVGGNLTTANIITTGSSGNISGANYITANSFVGLIATNAQTYITSLGTLTGLTVSGAIVPNGNNSVNLGSTSAWWATMYGQSIQAKYADLAECYAADAEYEPGTVLDFGGEQEVTLSTEYGSTYIAGVVSTNPAYLMNSTLEAEYITPIALQGRVPTKVIGPVRKGQMMVSAGNGFAIVSSMPNIGSVIGKAIENFNGDTGIIEVVVGRL